jgi:hypothetical protein
MGSDDNGWMPADDPFDFETFRAWAAHEAAHAVVTAGLGIPVRRVLVVQLTSELKLLYDGSDPKEDCSHSKPDSDAYRAADALRRCLVARAGEVGQRLYVGSPTVLERDQWIGDAMEIERETGLSGAAVERVLSTLGVAVETWLKQPEPNRVWSVLTDALIAGCGPHRNDPQCSRSVLEGETLQGLLAEMPKFPVELLPEMPTAPTTQPVEG